MLILFDAFLKLLYSFVHVSQEDILNRISQRLDYDSRNSQPNPVASLTLSITGNHILHFMWYLTGIRMQNRMAFGIGRNCESWDEIRHLYSFAKKLALKISSSEQYFKRARRLSDSFVFWSPRVNSQTADEVCRMSPSKWAFSLSPRGLTICCESGRPFRFYWITLRNWTTVDQG